MLTLPVSRGVLSNNPNAGLDFRKFSKTWVRALLQAILNHWINSYCDDLWSHHVELVKMKGTVDKQIRLPCLWLHNNTILAEVGWYCIYLSLILHLLLLCQHSSTSWAPTLHALSPSSHVNLFAVGVNMLIRPLIHSWWGRTKLQLLIISLNFCKL